MTNYQPGDIVLIDFPFSGTTQKKARPALVILDTGDADIVIARITTQTHQTAFDFQLAEWQKAGLKAPSVVRLHKLATMDKGLVQRPLGSLEPKDRQAIAAGVPQLFKGW